MEGKGKFLLGRKVNYDAVIKLRINIKLYTETKSFIFKYRIE